MGFFEIIHTFAQENIATLSWKDILEISFFAFIFYGIIRWLAADRQKKLLTYFLISCAFILTSYALELNTINSFLFTYATPFIMLVILVHQRTLQKSFVALKKPLKEKQSTDYQWIEVLIRTMLKTISTNKSITCIIERNDVLNDLVVSNLPISCQITLSTLSSLIESSLFDERSMLWATDTGLIRGFNTSIHHTEMQPEDPATARYLDALFLSSTTDALIIMADPHSRSFTILAAGKIIAELNAHHAQRLLTTLINPPKKGDNHHAVFTQTHRSTGKQPHI